MQAEHSLYTTSHMQSFLRFLLIHDTAWHIYNLRNRALYVRLHFYVHQGVCSQNRRVNVT